MYTREKPDHQRLGAALFRPNQTAAATAQGPLVRHAGVTPRSDDDHPLPQMRTWKFNQFVRMHERHGFVLDRQSGNSRIYKGRIGGKVRLVSVHFHRGSDDIKPGTLAAMIRVSGLPKKNFR